jgi:putative isomerase
MRCFTYPLALLMVFSIFALRVSRGQIPAQPLSDWTSNLEREVKTLGKPAWRPMLAYDVSMHRASTHPATPPFVYPWEDTGTGYGYGPGFGHWDLVHEILDVLPSAPDHAREQLLNDIGLQLPSGFLPGLYWMRSDRTKVDAAVADVANVKFSPTQTHPPVWVVAADDYLQQTSHEASGDNRALTANFLDALTMQASWFEENRRAKPDGFLYSDITTNQWESGVDEGVRFDGTGPGHKPTSTACVDATAHVYQMYLYGAKWSRLLGRDARPFEAKAAHLREFMRSKLWSERDGYFYDSWVLERDPDGPKESWHKTVAPGRAHPFEGMWPMIVGAADRRQAARVIGEWLMRKDRFFTAHPIATVAVTDRKFEPRMWRGPAWNSMTYWAARGASNYGSRKQARALLEAALDDTALQYKRTGKIWEFYSATGGRPEDLKRKPQTTRNEPFSDYLGHNPMLAMARMWTEMGDTVPTRTREP